MEEREADRLESGFLSARGVLTPYERQCQFNLNAAGDAASSAISQPQIRQVAGKRALRRCEIVPFAARSFAEK